MDGATIRPTVTITDKFAILTWLAPNTCGATTIFTM